MRKYAAGRTARSAAVFVLMLLLFPYIVSVFVNGAGSDEKPFHVRVRTEDGSGNETVAEVAWPEYLDRGRGGMAGVSGRDPGAGNAGGL